MVYSCEYQNEIQSALWSHRSVQLFTAARFKDGKCTKTYLICSDTKDKNKDTVFVFINKLIEIMLHTDKQDVVIYRDGPSSEFKNKYIACLMMFLRRKFNVNITWKYFATSHGNGVVAKQNRWFVNCPKHKVISLLFNHHLSFIWLHPVS